MTLNVVHLTSAHARDDIRIFVKMCSSLSAQGYSVSLIVADGLGNESQAGVAIIDVGANNNGRLGRMTKTVDLIYRKALELDAEVYHLHDPELMPVGLKLKKKGKKVIFDAHEDLPKQLISKPYLNRPARAFLSKTLAAYERYVCAKFDAVVAATPFIRDKFLPINPNCVDVNNFPLLDELANASDWSEKHNEVAYIGGIAKIRGIEEVVQSLSFTRGVHLNLAGSFSEQSTEERVKSFPGWSQVNVLGFLNRRGISLVLARSKAGLVTLHPTINYLESLPIKMFEYMSAGLPVVSSNFPLWQAIIEDNDCGICVDPFDFQSIGAAIQYLIDNPDEAQRMGNNGRKAIETKYNWSSEQIKLFRLYDSVIEK